MVKGHWPPGSGSAVLHGLVAVVTCAGPGPKWLIKAEASFVAAFPCLCLVVRSVSAARVRWSGTQEPTLRVLLSLSMFWCFQEGSSALVALLVRIHMSLACFKWLFFIKSSLKEDLQDEGYCQVINILYTYTRDSI